MSESQTQGKGLLLISNSTLHGSGYLDHAEQEIRNALGAIKRVLFVPFALFDRDAYASQARKRFEEMGYALDSIHEATDAKTAGNKVDTAEAIFIGGGTPFGCWIVSTGLICWSQYAGGLRRECFTWAPVPARWWPHRQ